MLAQERYSIILKILNEKGAVSASALTSVVGASEATIRRDITALAKMGKINKVFGGATRLNSHYTYQENNMRTKLGLNMEEKSAIAKYCASLICDQDIIYLDAGSTTLLIIDYIHESKALFVTTGLAQAQKLMKLGLKTCIIGGYLKKQTDAIIGSEAVKCILKYNFTKAFMGCNGITIQNGFTTPDFEEGNVKSVAIAQSSEVYFLADSTKFGKVCASQIAQIENGVIVTEKIPDSSYEQQTTVKEVTL